MKILILDYFLSLSAWICLISQIMIVLMVQDSYTTTNYLYLWHNHAKLGQFYRKKVKILILDYFSSLSAWICLILQIMIALMVQDSYTTTNGLIIEHPWRLKYLTFLLTHCTPFDLWALISEVHINRCLFCSKLPFYERFNVMKPDFREVFKVDF